jgi:phosphoribosyl 1,2-cyclic phosphodiesterase
VRVTVLGSGSKGNSLVVELGAVRIAVDAGFGVRRLAKRLKAAGIAPESVSACAITHEHLDHARGARPARAKWQWTLAATPPTLVAMGVAHATARVTPLRYGESLMVDHVKITLIEVSHDAVAPAAVLLEDTKTGARIGVAHDLGEVPDRLFDAFARLDMLVLEANHDMGMLRTGPYPPFLQDRIAGVRGHLSNAQSAAFVRRVAHPGLRAIVLAHLSEQNNTPALAFGAVDRALRGSGFRGKLIAAAQHAACAVGAARTAQLSLF